MIPIAATYNTLYLDARRALRAAGSDNAQLEAMELLGFACEKSREALYRDMALYAPDGAVRRFRELMDRRLRGEPVAYLVGEWEFYGVPLDISPEVLIPREDTEVLARQAILRADALPGEPRVLDLCAGSGCVGLAVAVHCPRAALILADLSDGALRVSRQNIRRNGLENRVSTCRADALEKPPRALGDFDVIAANPPYIPSGEIAGLDDSVRLYEPHLALDGGADGLDFYRAITQRWTAALRPGGWLMCEVGLGQSDPVEKLFVRAGLEEIQTYPDTAGIWRVVEGRLPPRQGPQPPIK